MMASTSQSSLDLLSMIWNPYHMIQQAVSPYYNQKSTPTILIDLNDYCLMNIYRFLDYKDLFRCRSVCRCLSNSVDNYLKTKIELLYDCRLNGISRSHGQYKFNLKVFESLIRRMPNIRILRFEKCNVMKSALATCRYDLFDQITEYLPNLCVLHLGRAFFLQQDSIYKLSKACPNICSLSLTIYKEQILALIVSCFPNLRFLNLLQSILYEYAPILRNLPPNIRGLILPEFYVNSSKDVKMEILRCICDGHGINLERLELSVVITDIQKDSKYFETLGQMLGKLRWFQCNFFCNGSAREKSRTRVRQIEQQQEINNNDDDDFCLSWNLISGLHHLKNLRVLILKEDDYYDEAMVRSSLFDNQSLLKIFQYCRKLIMISISCGLRRNKPDYVQENMNRKQDEETINQILKESFDCDTKEINDDGDYYHSKEANFKNYPSHNNHFNQSDINIDNNNDDSYMITDDSLATIDCYLPKLKILRLRGVKIGRPTFDSISNLKFLRYLRLDSIQFSQNDHFKIKESFDDLMKNLTCSRNLDDCRLKTVIHLTNIPLI